MVGGSTATRRQWLAVAAATLGLAPIAAWLGGSRLSSRAAAPASSFPVTRSDAEWRSVLTPEQYHVVRGHATERPFSSALDHEARKGTFRCVACGQPLFSSATKYDSGTGWPSFWAPLENAVGTTIDRSFFMLRTEVHCTRCGGHLGHVFADGPEPTGLRYCINGTAMTFVPQA